MKIYQPKPLFIERMRELLGKDFQDYMEILKHEPVRSIRANKLKISPEELKKRLENKGWKISQPFKDNPEIIIVEGKYINDSEKNLLTDKKDVQINNEGGDGDGGGLKQNKKLIGLEPGELGRALEHLLGYYYIQEIASMLPVLALKPKPEEFVLDLAAAPGSKTTQMVAEMQNTGTVIANEISLKRIKILASNVERCGSMNVIITKKEGISLCEKLKKEGFEFDKILVDAPCSGEGTLRSTPITYKMWNINTVKKFSKIQKNMVSSAIEILKPEGEIVYSTCTHAPEENEEVVDFILKNFDNIKIEKISLPIKCRPGITGWDRKKYNKNVIKSCRIYPQDNNTEGFFIAKFRRVK
ncbi:MAG TPA: RsmB/NOP family class I SAM-dependent RNA methyltransferase [Candidatus Pacearchaeota archaeon]|nr:RsmB/NOP family class I SAM-dependent RNA methyltransferase [Candidatus Pacearchaeota archaeon]